MTTAIILAGGMGTRLRSAVSDVPKPMAPIMGRPFLEHQMDFWMRQGVNNFILSVGYMREIITGHFGNSYKGVKITYAIEETPLGTGGGLLLAAQKLPDDSPTLVLNGDTFFDANFGDLEKFHNKHNSEWTFALARANEVGRYTGLEIDEEGQIISLKSGTDKIGRLINSGVYLINPAILKDFSAETGTKISLEDDIFPRFMAAKKMLYGLEFTGNFIDIGVPEDYFRADTILPNCK